MNKFDNILSRYGIITEQPQDQPIGSPEEQSVETSSQSAIPSDATDTPPTIDDQQVPEAKIKKLDPANFVWLVTVIKNAFLAHPELEDHKTVAELKGADGEPIEDINVENAQEILDKIWPVISKYMPSEIKTYHQSDANVAKLLQKAD